jgi:hypothetical protein
MKTRIISARGLMIMIGLLFTGGWAMAQQPAIQYFRAYDKRGVNVFETSKNDTVQYDGFKLRIGAGFTQGFQSLNHSNNARALLNPASGSGIVLLETAPGSGSFVNRATGAPVTGVVANPNAYAGYLYNGVPYTNANALYEMGGGFPLAQANLNIDVQLADGVSLNLVSYMSSHHHNEFWVKGGYLKIEFPEQRIHG